MKAKKSNRNGLLKYAVATLAMLAGTGCAPVTPSTTGAASAAGALGALTAPRRNDGASPGAGNGAIIPFPRLRPPQKNAELIDTQSYGPIVPWTPVKDLGIPPSGTLLGSNAILTPGLLGPATKFEPGAKVGTIVPMTKSLADSFATAFDGVPPGQ